MDRIEFETEVLPSLRWAKARDLFLYSDSKSKYINDMGSLIKSNLAHAEAESWLTEMKSFLKGSFKESDYYAEDGLAPKSEAKTDA